MDDITNSRTGKTERQSAAESERIINVTMQQLFDFSFEETQMTLMMMMMMMMMMWRLSTCCIFGRIARTLLRPEEKSYLKSKYFLSSEKLKYLMGSDKSKYLLGSEKR